MDAKLSVEQTERSNGSYERSVANEKTDKSQSRSRASLVVASGNAQHRGSHSNYYSRLSHARSSTAGDVKLPDIVGKTPAELVKFKSLISDISHKLDECHNNSGEQHKTTDENHKLSETLATMLPLLEQAKEMSLSYEAAHEAAYFAKCKKLSTEERINGLKAAALELEGVIANGQVKHETAMKIKVSQQREISKLVLTHF